MTSPLMGDPFMQRVVKEMPYDQVVIEAIFRMVIPVFEKDALNSALSMHVINKVTSCSVDWRPSVRASNGRISPRLPHI